MQQSIDLVPWRLIVLAALGGALELYDFVVYWLSSGCTDASVRGLRHRKSLRHERSRRRPTKHPKFLDGGSLHIADQAQRDALTLRLCLLPQHGALPLTC